MAETVPLLSCAEAKDWEARVLPDPGAATEAMHRAGRALASAVERDFAWWRAWPEAPRVLVLAGKGHNAGDALVATLALAENAPSLRASVVWVFGREGLKPNVIEVAARLRNLLGENLTELEGTVVGEAGVLPETFDLTLDGIMGMGFRAPWREPGERVVAWTEKAGDRLGFRVAVDLPSGLGDEPAETVFAADVTYATGILKAPLLAAGATQWTGRIRFLDLGFFAGERPEGGFEEVATQAILRRIGRLRSAESDKRAYGRIFLLGGSQRFPGAMLMSTLATVRAGAGLVTTMVPMSIAPYLASAVPEAMWLPLPASGEGSLGSESMRRITQTIGDRGVLLIGPGMVPDRANIFLVSRMVREVPHPLILDAGALAADVVHALAGRPQEHGPVILTPHFGEYRRMLEQPVEDFERETFLRFCRRCRVTVILKGPVSRVSDGERLIHLPVGNPTLSRGGSGDILGGLVAARLAAQPEDPLQAAVEATAWHGEAADALAAERGEVGVRTTELLDFLAPALRSAW